ncbi:MAG TPA: lipoyl synthase [Phycisphaerae bacterium]|nr:lipoyl synthase [Phycisphaerae bacterium]HNU45902.1 lipoyl synthase [Phycisphaerae bacterium]
MKLPVLSTPGDRPAGRRLPPWLKRPLPSGEFSATKAVVADSGVATVCQEARCPNLGECWSKRHATFMILGDRCTRRCHFCAVHTARPEPPAGDEPDRLADAVARLGFRHVVLTAVARDDLADEGAGHFAQCVAAVHQRSPRTTVEVLPADFHARRECIETLCAARPQLYNHNLEMVERLTPMVRPQGNYRRSLEVLRLVKEIAPRIVTKSGLMVGLGETIDELHRTFADLRGVGCDVLTVGQYLAPTTGQHWPVKKFYHPEEFDALREQALSLGFLSVAAGPFVRSSYNAENVFAESLLRLSAAAADGVQTERVPPS